MSPTLGSKPLQDFTGKSGFGFSGHKADDLEAAEYTIAGLVQDTSISVGGFKPEMIECIRTIIKSCSHSPRSDNLMIRTNTFDTSVKEFHGFQMLSGISPDDYNNVLDNLGGRTALYDGTLEMIDAIGTYGEDLSKQGILVNGILFIITDGMDNCSAHAASKIKSRLEEIKREESLESLLAVLVCVGDDQVVVDYCENFKKDAGLHQFVKIGDADESKMARLADFVSRSISSQSQSLGSGGASVPLTF